jgi:hypothetical protein
MIEYVRDRHKAVVRRQGGREAYQGLWRNCMWSSMSRLTDSRTARTVVTTWPNNNLAEPESQGRLLAMIETSPQDRVYGCCDGKLMLFVVMLDKQSVAGLMEKGSRSRIKAMSLTGCRLASP